MTELRQCDDYAAYLQNIGWVAQQSPRKNWVYLRKLPLLPFWVMKIQRVSWFDWDSQWWQQLRQDYRIILTYVEFLETLSASRQKKLKQWKFRPQSGGMLPTRTLLLETKMSAKQFLSQMKSKTRYNIGLAQKHELQVEIVTGTNLMEEKPKFVEFISLLHKNNRRLGLLSVKQAWIEAKLEAFEDKAFVVLVRDSKNELLAAGLFLCTSDGVYYQENGSSQLGRRMMAPSLVIFEAFLETKKRKLRYLDFDGIYDDRYPIKRWLGFSHFKKSFGGKEISYPGAYKRWW